MPNPHLFMVKSLFLNVFFGSGYVLPQFLWPYELPLPSFEVVKFGSQCGSVPNGQTRGVINAGVT